MLFPLKNITNPYLDKKAWNVISHHSLSEVCSCVAANTLTLTPSHQNNSEKLYFTKIKVLTLRLVIGITSPAIVRVRVWFCQLFAPLTATGQWIGCCNAVMLNTGIIARLAQSRTSSSRLQVCSALVWVRADNKHNNPKLFVNLYDVKKIVRFLSRTLIRGATTASQNTWKNVIPSVFIWLMVFCSESQFFENHEIPLYF